MNEYQEAFSKIRRSALLSQNNRDIGIKWFRISEDDYKVSNILFEKEMIPSSVYHLQQCFEKLAKSFFILSSTVDPNDVYNHNFTNKRIQTIFNEEWAKAAMIMYKAINKKELEVNSGVKILKDLSLNEIRKININGLNQIFEFINKLENKFVSTTFIDIIQKKTSKGSFIRMMKHWVFEWTRIRTRESDVREHITVKAIEKYISDIIIALKINYFSIITAPHFNTPRYPYSKETKFGFFDYKKGLGIVDAMPKLLAIVNDLLINFNKNYEVD